MQVVMPLLAESHHLFGEICMESHNFDNMLVPALESRHGNKPSR